MAATNTYKLIYFNGGGRAEVARYLFALSNTKYEDQRIEREGWPALKPTTPLGQLPVLVFNGIQYVQSDAIYRFLARQFKLFGKNELDGLKIDQIVATVGDAFTEWVQVSFVLQGADKDKAKEKLISETVPKVLKFVEKQLGSNNWIVGDSASLADVIVADFFGAKVPTILGDAWQSHSAAVTSLTKRFNDLPAIKAYVAKRPQGMA